jgi:hypothetical protein
MSKIVSLTGTVSGARVDTSISVNNTTTINNYGSSSYAPTATTSSQTVVNKTMAFRIDNRPANLAVAVNLTNGDSVTAAGIDKAEFEVLAINNHTTRTMYWVPGPNTIAPVIYIVIGVFTTGLYGIGWLLIVGGILFLSAANKRKGQIAEAKALVKKAQVSK